MLPVFQNAGGWTDAFLDPMRQVGDPVADGVVVQAAAQASLDQGTTLTDCLAAVRTLRAGGVTIPLILMSYANPPMAYGLERFGADAALAGADGFIVPDLPPEEAGEFLAIAQKHGLALIEFLAPTSNADRIRLVTETAQGFIYLVSVTGVTGARDQLSSELPAFVRRVREMTDLPLSIGFGISQPDHVKQIKQIADGVIVASALLRAFEREGLSATIDLARQLRSAC